MKFLATLFTMIIICQFAIGQTGSLQGKITDINESDGWGLPFVSVSVQVNGTLVGAQTDFDGFYKLDNLPSGTHTIEFSYVGYETSKEEVVINADQITFLDLTMSEEKYLTCCGCGCHSIEYTIPLYEQDDMTLGYTYGRWDMRTR